jgi:hypothetical protein
VSFVRRDCRLGRRASAEAVRLYVGAAAPNIGATAGVCERLAPCSLGYGRLGRAASWLEHERWYVGTAVPEGGVGGLLGVVEQLDAGAAAPEV